VASNASNAKVVFEAESSADGQVTSLEISDSLAAAAPRTQDSIGAAAYGSNSNNLTDLAGNTDAESAPDSRPQDLFGATDEHEQIESAEVLITSSPLPYPTPTPLPTATVVPPVQRPMTFIDYGINAFTDTAADNLSTFSVDVDTGSYTIARRYLNDGRLPPSEAIRVEEFVNYFDYGYEQPAEDDVFAIHVDSYPSPFTERRVLM